ncbi:hypothetical protein ES708_34174 [subsurface metagenome]
MIKIKKIKYRKIILIFVAIFILVLFIGKLSGKEVKSETNPSITIVDINEKNKFQNAVFLDALIERNALPRNIEILIKSLINSEMKTTKEVINEFENLTLIEWILEYKYSVGCRINCVIGDWIILVNE